MKTKHNTHRDSEQIRADVGKNLAPPAGLAAAAGWRSPQTNCIPTNVAYYTVLPA